MSEILLSGSGLANRRIPVNQISDEEWIRHPAWVALPELTAADSEVCGLYAIWPESNFLAMTCTGNYTVDWGDGSTENFSSGVTAYHEYDFTDVDLTNTNGPVTFTDSGDLVNRTAHGFQNGYRVSFYNIVTTVGLMEGAAYYVVNAAADTFQVATEKNGSSIALTNDGSATLLPYKQALVRITPNGGTLTTVNLTVKHNKASLADGYGTGWLDLLIAGKDFNATGITMNSNTTVVTHPMAERVSARSFGAKVDLQYLLQAYYHLQTVDFGSATSSTTNMTGFFVSCHELTTVPLFDTSNVVTMESMFSGTGVATVPLLNTSNVTNMSSMFAYCRNLKTVPLFDTSNVTTMHSMFYLCVRLEEVPAFNMASMDILSYLFRECPSLKVVPLFNTASVTKMNWMFQQCSNIRSIPFFNTANVTAMDGMFSGCSKLKTVPPFDTSNVTGISSMFSNAFSLTSVPPLNTANVVASDNLFNSCFCLTEIPAMSLASVTTSSYPNMYSYCRSLSSIKMTGHRLTFSVFNCKLSSAALNELYTNLATVTGQTITVTGNHGVAADDPTIATSKGWTVTG